jgi:quinol monooxygenase YgiN
MKLKKQTLLEQYRDEAADLRHKQSEAIARGLVDHVSWLMREEDDRSDELNDYLKDIKEK